MFELKTIARKADHPLLAVPEKPAAREPNQRRLMTVALVLLLLALGALLYRDRDFWFPDNSEAEDQLGPIPVTASPAKETAAAQPSAPKTVTAEKAPEKNAVVAKAQPKVSIPTPVAPAATEPAPPPTSTVRTVLPPLEVEVVAGNNLNSVRPKTNAVGVDLQRGVPGRVASSAPAVSAPVDSTASVTTPAAERVQMSAGGAEVVGQPVKPGYPMLARQMRVQGSVILQALIGRDGTIQNLKVLSGPGILATAAQEAVRQWRFKPHYQGGESVETLANITVNFTISTN